MLVYTRFVEGGQINERLFNFVVLFLGVLPVMSVFSLLHRSICRHEIDWNVCVGGIVQLYLGNLVVWSL